ncbi:MAG TPA: hypothetical protein VGL56_08175 [Fimbriimonadaceae bacterium]|jgi:hypothetical protein
MKRFLVWIAFAGVAVGAAAWGRQGSDLYINGNLASSGIIMHNGSAYVPVKDVAAALKLAITKTPRGLELADAAGANQVTGITGKVEDVLWNGYIRFQIVKIIRAKTYTNEFTGDNKVITPDKPNDDLFVAVCKISNGLKNGVTVMYPGSETALADDQGQSYSPFLGMSADIASRGTDLLPGASFGFALTFEIPTSAVVGDLVYQATMGGSNTNGVEKKKFRVSVKQ